MLKMERTRALLHRATVLQIEGFLAYGFDDGKLNTDPTSGAAVLNQAGEVVGLNIGYNRSSNERLVEVGDRLATLQRVVAALP